MTSEISELEKATKLLAGELVKIKASLDIYKILGFNSVAVNSSIGIGKEFLAFAQMFSGEATLYRLHNVYEQPDCQYQRCSIQGVFSLAKKHSTLYGVDASKFVIKYDNVPTGNWEYDVRGVISRQKKVMEKTLEQINGFRNQRLGHIELVDIGELNHVPYDALEKLFNFASDFCSFIHHSFVGVALQSIPDYRKCEYSLIGLLEQIGVSNPVRHFSVPKEPQSNPEQ